MPTTFLLRNVDDKLWTRVKARAKADDLSLRALIMALLRGYADKRVSVSAADE